MPRPNQYSGIKPIKRKCGYSKCKTMLDILPGVAKRHNKSFCCKEHYHLAKVGKKWTSKILKYVQENILTEGYEMVAKKVGSSVPSLRRQVTIWRNEGKHIPYQRNLEIGTTGIWHWRGVAVEYQKTENGWKKIRRITPYKPKPPKKEKVIKEKKIRAPKQQKIIKPIKEKKPLLTYSTIRRTPKPEVKKFATREIDMSQYKYVRVDSKTLVLKRLHNNN